MRANRLVLFRDFLIFFGKLWVDGLKDGLLIALSVAAVAVDMLFGGTRKRLFYTVMRFGERVDLWLNLHGPLARGDQSDDGLFGASAAGSNTLVGKLEQVIRGGDEPRSRRDRDSRRGRGG